MCGIEVDIVGRGSYDNIIEDFWGVVNDDSEQGVSTVKECKAQSKPTSRRRNRKSK